VSYKIPAQPIDNNQQAYRKFGGPGLAGPFSDFDLLKITMSGMPHSVAIFDGWALIPPTSDVLV
jgi:hypothetical protein